MKQIIKCPACLGGEEWRWNTPHFRALWGPFTAKLILTSLQVVGILETGYLFAMLDNWSSLFWDCLLRDNRIICPAQEDKYLVCLLLSRLNYKKILSGQIWMMFKKMAEAFDVDYYEKLNSMLLCTDNFFQGLFFQGWQLNVEDNWIICII